MPDAITQIKILGVIHRAEVANGLAVEQEEHAWMLKPTLPAIEISVDLDRIIAGDIAGRRPDGDGRTVSRSDTIRIPGLGCLGLSGAELDGRAGQMLNGR